MKRLSAFATAFAVLALGAVAAGAGATTTTTAARTAFPTGPVTITWWWWGEQEAPGAKKWVAETVKLYEKKHPNVTIKAVMQTTDGLYPAFEAAAAAKKGPDLQLFWGGIWSLQDAWAGHTVPVSNYIPKSELAHYLNASEDSYDNKVWTAPWYVQPSYPVLYRKDVLAKYHVSPPKTWNQLLSACDTLSKHGITTLAGGVKDGWFGGYLWSQIGNQNLKSVSDLLQAVTGGKSFTDPEFATWWSRLDELKQHKCLNPDITSLEQYQGQQPWLDGKAAMTMTPGSQVPGFVKKIGVSKIGVMAMPTWASGPYAGKLASTSQTFGITSWSKHPEVAADMIRFFHTRDRLNAWFEDTGVFPADNRFDAKQIKLPQMKQLFSMVQKWNPYLENFIPTELDSKGNFSNVQLLLAGSESPSSAASSMQSVAKRVGLTNRDLISNFKTWSKQYAK